MHFSKILALLISTVSVTVLSAPILHHGHNSITPSTISGNTKPIFDESSIVERGYHAEGNPTPDTFVEIHTRAPSRGQYKKDKAEAKAKRIAKAAERGKKRPDRPSNAKITFGKAARAKLDELGLHGKDRKKVKAYHKKVAKQGMAAEDAAGASEARIFHLAHKGGSDPKEENHLTVGYYKAPAVGQKPGTGEQIISKWAKQRLEDNPNAEVKGLFHVYPHKQEHKIDVPSAWSHIAEASETRKKVEAAAAIAEKAQKISQEKEAGQRLTDTEKQAMRTERAAAKATKKAAAKAAKNANPQ